MTKEKFSKEKQDTKLMNCQEKHKEKKSDD